ncbi:AMP-binding protein [Streptomyces sp. NBC_00557]|uniref:AMP-binding protein n=1 Tax=Streptomyces sp. NBC_00557 TaxID=2975776 RepID=UPI002E8151CD|nr:AMP-binding protein [Streptomyces sp. NBC_00557]WUC40329.1 AMP-binding protein [Streptomyces sp. NBC_00557]
MQGNDVTVPGLLDWLDAPRADRGVNILDLAGEWQYTPYSDLAEHTKAAAAAFTAAGVRPGDVVSIIHRNGPGFIAAFFGALAAGATPSPAVPPALFQDRAAYSRHVGAILDVAAPRVVVLEPELLDQLGPGLRDLGHHPLALEETTGTPAGSPSADRAALPPTALLQFTSGSSATPKGVAVSPQALHAQISILVRWLGFHSGNACGTWLPIHHDMGLVGMVLPSVVTQSNLWVMQPDQFITGASRWLRLLGSGRVQITAVPPFSLKHMLRRVRDEELTGCDFSKVRVNVVGAEPIDGSVLDEFTRRLAPFGWPSGALVPAYGLAEAVLAVSGKDLDAPVDRVLVDRGRLRLGEKVVVDSGEVPAAEALDLPASGRVLPGVTVEVRDEAGDPVPDGVLGEIVVGGVSLADGYRGHEPWPGEFVTGDAGFFWKERLYVLGRLGDSLKVRGVQLFAEDIENALSGLEALGKVRYSVVLGSLDGRDTVAALVVKRPGEWSEEVYRALRRQARGLRVVVAAVNRGALRRTSSGKPKRRAMFEQLMTGTIDGVVVHDSANDPAEEEQ